jgi:signal transduction histidine kinase
MLSFRKKILLSDVILFLVFIALLFPFVERTVGNIMRKSLESRAQQLIDRLKTAPDLSDMLDIMQTEEAFIFQRVTLYDFDQNVLYDSHAPKKAAVSEERADQAKQPEIESAIQYGRGYSEHYSPVFHETFAFVALSFESHGRKYILRTGFPFDDIRELTIDFEVGFLLLGAFILMLYSVMTWAIIHRLSRPIQQIIDAIIPYQEGREEYLPRIVLNQAIQGDEFSKLAFTLNSLTDRIQKQIENLMQQRKETEGILESLSEGVVALDTSAKVTFANQVACGMLRVTHDALMGQPLDHIKSTNEGLLRKCHELVLQALQTSEPIVQTWTLGEGGRIYLDLISSPLAHQSGALLVLQDKTSDYKVLEMGKDFIANASHELRTPITIIRGFAETLQDLPELSQEMLNEITEKIVRTCGRLDKLVKSLLTMADIENLSDDRLRNCDLVILAENCKHLLLTAHPDVQVAMKSDVYRAPIVADSELLDLAIMNLLENAVKYSPHPAQIEISIQKAENAIQLSVKDKGIGIPDPDLPHIFDRFYTVDKARSRKSGGAGLGLSIVKTIIEKHKGAVKVTSELGKGSTFTISLPLKKS